MGVKWPEGGRLSAIFLDWIPRWTFHCGSPRQCHSFPHLMFLSIQSSTKAFIKLFNWSINQWRAFGSEIWRPIITRCFKLRHLQFWGEVDHKRKIVAVLTKKTYIHFYIIQLGIQIHERSGGDNTSIPQPFREFLGEFGWKLLFLDYDFITLPILENAIRVSQKRKKPECYCWTVGLNFWEKGNTMMFHKEK